MVNSYQFIALSKDKQKIKGKVEASSIDELRSIISFHDYYLVKYKKVKNKQKLIERTIKQKDIQSLCKNMALMLKSGQSLINVIDLISQTTNNKTLKQMLNYTKVEMRNGKSFTSSLKKYKKYFDNMFISMIEIGELSSTLKEVFEYLSKYYDNKNKIKSKIINALFYPTILLLLTCIIVFIMCLYILPMYQSIFIENNMDLPLMTNILFMISNFINNNFIFVLLTLILIVLLGIFFIISNKGKLIINFLLSKIPIIKNIYKTINFYMISSSLDIMLMNKISLVDATCILVNSLNDRFLIRKFKWVSDELRRGQTLSKSLESFNYFPKMFIEMIRNGENVNSLGVEMRNISNYYFNKVLDILTKLTVFIEPSLIIIIAIFAGLIMACVFVPMLSLLSNIG